MLVSLVLATVGRTAELGRFLAAARAQSHREFEVVVVDQNPDDRLLPVLDSFQDAKRIRRVRSQPGVSRARNVGLSSARGEIVAFPDDDCWYEPDLLARVVAWLADHPEYHGLCGRALDEHGQDTVGPALAVAGPVRRELVWRQGMSITIFLRRSVIEAVGGFREDLGVGSGTPWGAGEETELLLRALAHGFRLYYDPAFVVGHPPSLGGLDPSDFRRVRLYSGALGRVLRLHRFPPWTVGRLLIRPFLGCVLSCATLNFRRAAYYWTSWRARIAGFCARTGPADAGAGNTGPRSALASPGGPLGEETIRRTVE